MDDLERARQIMERDPFPESWAEALERAREIVREVGDLPEPVAYEMIMRGSPPGTDVLGDIDRVRGPGAPNYPPTGRI